MYLDAMQVSVMHTANSARTNCGSLARQSDNGIRNEHQRDLGSRKVVISDHHKGNRNRCWRYSPLWLRAMFVPIAGRALEPVWLSAVALFESASVLDESWTEIRNKEEH